MEQRKHHVAICCKCLGCCSVQRCPLDSRSARATALCSGCLCCLLQLGCSAKGTWEQAACQDVAWAHHATARGQQLIQLRHRLTAMQTQQPGQLFKRQLRCAACRTGTGRMQGLHCRLRLLLHTLPACCVCSTAACKLPHRCHVLLLATDSARGGGGVGSLPLQPLLQQRLARQLAGGIDSQLALRAGKQASCLAFACLQCRWWCSGILRRQ